MFPKVTESKLVFVEVQSNGDWASNNKSYSLCFVNVSVEFPEL